MSLQSKFSACLEAPVYVSKVLAITINKNKRFFLNDEQHLEYILKISNCSINLGMIGLLPTTDSVFLIKLSYFVLCFMVICCSS